MHSFTRSTRTSSVSVFAVDPQEEQVTKQQAETGRSDGRAERAARRARREGLAYNALAE